MHFRSLRSFAVFTLPALLLLGTATPAVAAGEKDKDALKLFDDAINNDYLNAEIPKAITKLKDAIKLCGASNCTPQVVGKLHVGLGTMYGAGQNKLPEAQAEFELALKADPGAAVDSALTNPDLDKAFAAAKTAVAAGGAGGAAGAGGAGGTAGAGGGKKPPTSAPSGDANHTPPPEQMVNTPVPIYLEPSEEVPLSKVTLRYKPFGSKTYKSVELPKIGKGFGGEIPCEDVTTTGDIKYFFALFDENGEAAGTLGSTKDPYKVTIKNEIEGDPPSLPGKKPPEQCKDTTPCPPDFPGCKEKDKTPPNGDTGPKEKRGDRGWGASCEESIQCQEGLGCKEGTCQEGAGDEKGGDDKKKKTKLNMVSVGFQLGGLAIGSRDNVCSPPAEGESANYYCFTQTDPPNQFDGVIAARTGTNGIQGGLGGVDFRMMAGYDRQFVQRIPISAGLRVGYAFIGSPSPGDAPTKNVPKANSFLPLHLELRATYHPLGAAYEAKKLRPYIFLVPFGVAQVNASVPVTVCDSSAADASKNTCKTKKPSVQTSVDAYQITGLNFFGIGGGGVYGITNNFGVSAEFKLMILYPTVGVVPTGMISPVVAF
ncbi:MAG: hypothetical protein U0359_17715 [Byssovorax sp.]